jgi:hypothetical protein
MRSVSIRNRVRDALLLACNLVLGGAMLFTRLWLVFESGKSEHRGDEGPLALTIPVTG